MNNEFQDALKNIDTMFKKILFNGENMLVYASVKEDNSRIFFIITNTYDYFWIDDFGAEDFDAHRKSIGLEGPLSNLVYLIVKTFSSEGDTLEIKMKKDVCELKLKYEVSKGVILTGTFLLNEKVTFGNNDEMAKSLSSQIIFNIIDFSKSNEQKLKTEICELKAQLNKYKENTSISQENLPKKQAIELTKSNSKVKPKADLVNPFKKKRKGGGVKIGSNNIKVKTE